MSTKFGKHRQLLRRPKVCAPGPPHPPPPANTTCSIDPAVFSIDEFDTRELTIVANNPNFSNLSPVEVAYTSDGPNFFGPASILNDVPDTANMDADVGEGNYTLTATFTFEDLSTCVATAAVTINPF